MKQGVLAISELLGVPSCSPCDKGTIVFYETKKAQETPLFCRNISNNRVHAHYFVPD